MRKVVPFLGVSLSALALAWPALSKAQAPFQDVPQDHWAYQYVTDLQSKGIINGYPDGYFRGKRALTRYEFATALDKALKAIQMMPGATGPAGPPGDVGPAGPQGPPGMTPEEVAELRRLIGEFQNELTSLGNDVRAIQNRLDALSRDVAELRDRINRMPRITGDFFTGFRSDRSRYAFADYSGAVRGSNPSLFSNVSSPTDFHLGINANLPGGATFIGDIMTGNYVSYRGGSLTFGSAAIPNAGFFQTTALYQAQLNIPIAGMGSHTELTLGRYKNQVTPLTFWRPDYDVYFDLPWYDDGNYVQDGFKLQSKFGSATTVLWAASHSSVVGNTLGSTFNQPMIGALGGPRFFGPIKPFGANNAGVLALAGTPFGAIAATQSAGLHVGIPISRWGEVGFTVIDLSTGGNTTALDGTAVPYTNLVVYGANIKLHPAGKFNGSAEFAKSVTQAKFDAGDGLSNDDNNAYIANVGYASGPVNVSAGYQYIDPRFSAPGYWNKIGNWYNPTNVQGPFVRLNYRFTPDILAHLGGDFLQGARNRGISSGYAPGLSINDNIERGDAGVQWKISKTFSTSVDYEGVFWDLSAASSASGHSSKPVEQYITIGVDLNLTSNTVLKMAYQMINLQDVGGGFGLPTGTSNAGVFTTQVAVHF